MAAAVTNEMKARMRIEDFIAAIGGIPSKRGKSMRIVGEW
jgi:hypothetical protein